MKLDCLTAKSTKPFKPGVYKISICTPKYRNDLIQSFGVQNIIGIQILDELAGARTQSGIPGCGLAFMLHFMIHCCEVIPLASTNPRVYQGFGVISRTIIDDYQFYRPIGLVPNRIKGFF
jgi:hypothetical protein